MYFSSWFSSRPLALLSCLNKNGWAFPNMWSWIRLIKKMQNSINNNNDDFYVVRTQFNWLVWGKQIRIKNDICIIDISDISKEYINLPTLTSHCSGENETPWSHFHAASQQDIRRRCSKVGIILFSLTK